MIVRRVLKTFLDSEQIKSVTGTKSVSRFLPQTKTRILCSPGENVNKISQLTSTRLRNNDGRGLFEGKKVVDYRKDSR